MDVILLFNFSEWVNFYVVAFIIDKSQTNVQCKWYKELAIVNMESIHLSLNLSKNKGTKILLKYVMLAMRLAKYF